MPLEQSCLRGLGVPGAKKPAERSGRERHHLGLLGGSRSRKTTPFFLKQPDWFALEGLYI